MSGDIGLNMYEQSFHYQSQPLGPVRQKWKKWLPFRYETVWHGEMVVTNGQPFLQGNNSLTSGVKPNGCYVVPNARSVFKFSKPKETVVCMGKRNGTVTSEQALSQQLPQRIQQQRTSFPSIPAHDRTQPPSRLTNGTTWYNSIVVGWFLLLRKQIFVFFSTLGTQKDGKWGKFNMN